MWTALALATAVAATPDELLARYRAAWDRADAADLAAFYAPAGELRTPYGVKAEGRRAIAAFYAAAFARGYAGSRGEARIGEVKPLTPELSLIRGGWAIRGARDQAGAPRPPECGELVAVLRRETRGRGWRILALHEFAGTCPAGA